MAGLSLKCGDCGALLKSVEEAQEHGELTSHSNFSESMEAVLNLVCTTCGKPFRSKTESSLHKKRTGHTKFVNKTSETTKPISLEVPKACASAEPEEGFETGESSQSGGEMVVPEVDKNLLGKLEEMGFPKARATRGLHYSGNANLEEAVNWVVEHDDDPDIDEMPMVHANTKVEASKPKPSLTPEEMKIKTQELREKARKKKEEEEKIMEREREKERIRAGKELLEAKRIEEENERKRLFFLRKAEKEEEKRAREKIRQKLEDDKDDEAKVKRAFQTLLTYVGNVAKNPTEEKFRKIRLNNPSFQERVGSLEGGIEFLELCGFEKIEGGEFLFLSGDKISMAVLNTAGAELNSAIVNPFFGVL
ncbi:UBX domain-containing protein 1-like isoform X3 [Macadamia integrifolia]|uniref:UBX domain-containing protein 1-like isoform X3 n=1 Tax=Macadamia integrifolia TaxID=60698 RepID=UPI001C4F0227|nr:UBX domain-containing protein 1-like isoform X3 [Macadamia integrifolia]